MISALVRRRLHVIIKDFRAGKTRDAMVSLCALAEWEGDVPEIAPAARPNGPTLGLGYALAPARKSAAREVRAQPKPRKRIIDPTAIAEYVCTHPDCELIGCMAAAPCPEPHHLVSRKMRGDDIASNLVRLCKVHHLAWHHGGKRLWLQQYRSSMTAELRGKVERALQLLEEPTQETG